ncbi:MAG: ATP-binding protein [Acidobacteria bacterium]|nr:ATP-binding protein [Acidobacteriota bacterium]
MADEAGRLTLTLANRTSEIERACTLVEQFANDKGLSPEAAYAVSLTLDEVLANVIRHGYDDTDEHTIGLHVSVEADVLSVRIEDDGRPFNPLLAPDPPLDLPIEERPVGGLGIHIVRTMMDELHYERVNGLNVLTLRKRVERLDPGTVA